MHSPTARASDLYSLALRIWRGSVESKPLPLLELFHDSVPVEQSRVSNVLDIRTWFGGLCSH
jgi:hypothetical protein